MDPNRLYEALFAFRIQIFESHAAQNVLFWVKIVTIVLSIALFIAVVDIFRKNWALEHRIGSVSGSPKKKKNTKIAVDAWVNILKKSESSSEQDLAFAIIEADKLVDSILKNGGFSGDTMAERLKRIDEHQLRSINDLWRAHKTRNEIVHTPGYRLSVDDAHGVLRNYQRVLQELEVI